MKRNLGIIGPRQPYQNTGISGVLDLYDYHTFKDDIPTRLTVDSVSSITGNGWNGSEWTWGVAANWNFSGSGLVAPNDTLYYTVNTVSGTQPAASLLDSGHWFGSITVTDSNSFTLTERLKIPDRPNVAYAFQWEIRTGSTSGPIVFTSSTYNIIPFNVSFPFSSSSYIEGAIPELTFTANGVSQGVNFKVDVTNNFNSNDFTNTNILTLQPTAGSNNIATVGPVSLSQQIRKDILIEGSEQYSVQVRGAGVPDIGTGYFKTTLGSTITQSFTITDTSYFHSVLVSDTSPDEGDTITVTVEAYDSASQIINWEVNYGSNVDDTDFYGGNPNGSTTMSSTTNSNGRHEASFNIFINEDFVTEGSETFTVKITNTVGQTLGTSATVTIADTATLGTVSQTATSINEGDTVTFTINVNGAAQGLGNYYNYYWRTIGLTSASGTPGKTTDFSDGAIEGSFTINGTTGQGTVSRTMASDGFTEGTETWKLQVGPSSSGPWQDAGSTVTVNDTSTGTAEPLPGIGNDVSNILSAVSSLTSSTNYATIISAINGAGRGYKVVATPRNGAMAENMSGVNGASALSTSGTGHFDYAAWDNSTDYLELSAGFSNNTLNGFPYMGFVMFNSSGPYGVAIMMYHDYTSSTTLLKNLWYPNQDRELYTYVLNANGSTVIDTSGNTSTIYSDGQYPGTNGYNSTSRFASDDGAWGFVNGTTRLDGNGGPYHSNNATNAYGPPANQNAGDFSQSNHYWGASYSSTSTDTAPVGGAYFFIRYS